MLSVMFLTSLLALTGFMTAHAVHAFTLPYSITPKDSYSNPFDFQNSQNMTIQDVYDATISIAGRDFQVTVDTGSSDLWLDTTGMDLSSFTNTSVMTSIAYV